MRTTSFLAILALLNAADALKLQQDDAAVDTTEGGAGDDGAAVEGTGEVGEGDGAEGEGAGDEGEGAGADGEDAGGEGDDGAAAETEGGDAGAGEETGAKMLFASVFAMSTAALALL